MQPAAALAIGFRPRVRIVVIVVVVVERPCLLQLEVHVWQGASGMTMHLESHRLRRDGDGEAGRHQRGAPGPYASA